MRSFNVLLGIAIYTLIAGLWTMRADAENWPRWRGPDGNGVSTESPLPIDWTTTKNIAWKVQIPGEGASSPIVYDDYLFLTSSLEEGTRRAVHCLDRRTGGLHWSREIEDDDPEITSALTGHAAPTPVTNGQLVVAFFGNAGVVCYDFAGYQRWHRDFGDFESELGLASSPILYRDMVILVCDHDGRSFTTFDSFLIALDVNTGKSRWKTDRPKLLRSWSTPVLVEVADGEWELIVNAQEALRGYDPQTGRQLWQVNGMTGWVTPSPVFGKGLVFAASGKDGPTMAVRPGGRGDVTQQHVIWDVKRGAPYVCSPLLCGDQLYVHNEQGILTCYEAKTGEVHYRQRLDGKFISSGVAGDGKIYLTNDQGETFVIRSGPQFQLLAENKLEEECLASPAVSHQALFIRTKTHLFCIQADR